MSAQCNLTYVLLVLNFAASCFGEEPGRPNIVLILADDLGYSDLGCFGGEIQTPVLDSLAYDGVRLTHFYTTGRCCPSRAALLTGEYPHRVGLGHMAGNDLRRPGYRGRIAEDAVTVAETLSEGGYRTFMAGKWHLGTEDPTKHGFEQFYGTLASAKRFFDPDHLIRLPKNQLARSYNTDTYYATDAITDHAVDFLDSATTTPEKPFFLYLAYNAPHFPLQAPVQSIHKYRGRYANGWDQLRIERIGRMKKLGIIPPNTTLSARSTWKNYGETKRGTNPAWKTLTEHRQKDLAQRMAIYAAMVDRM
ncbi:sulfatase-like hydrolase/transferase, partial [bacterium]|nr:sulfatase-like hydrolase/transferase [bacterium]